MDHQSLITRKLVLADGSPSDTVEAPEEMELAFAIGDELELPSSILALEEPLAEHLSHDVALAPRNLLRHTQRIIFHYRIADADGLYSAFYDLFTVLHGKGRRLRARLLKGASSRLAPEHFEALSSWLSNETPPAGKNLPEPPRSVLSQGVDGVCELVRAIETAGRPRRDPLVEAREHIEYSQIEEARDLLESAVLEDPDRAELQTELLHLYLATRDHEHFRTMREKLTEIVTTLPDEWQTLGEKPSGGD
jgi:hypothetical protein